MNMKKIISFFIVACCAMCATAAKVVWQIGVADNSGTELALGPSEYKKFLAHDFGYEDRYFLVGTSVDKNDFPYVLPGPDDTWGGTWSTSGWRTHDANILFGIKKLPKHGKWKLVVDLVDANPSRSVVKVMVNSAEKKFEIKGHSKGVLEGNLQDAKEQILEFPISANDLKKGGNMVTVSVLEGAGLFSIRYVWKVLTNLFWKRIMNMLSCAMWLRQNMKWKWMEQKYSLYWLM